MAVVKKSRPRRTPASKASSNGERKSPAALPGLTDQPQQPFLRPQLEGRRAGIRPAARPAISEAELRRRLRDLDLRPTVDFQRLLGVVNRLQNGSPHIDELPEEIRESLIALRPRQKSFHGSKYSLAYFPLRVLLSPCADKFGYLSSAAVRSATKLPFTIANQALLDQLGDIMGQAGRDNGPDSVIPAGFTYLGQFVDHDITLDVSSSLDVATDANTIHNMRSPVLDLDSVYGRGPALDPFLYEFPSSGPDTAIRMKLGTNQGNGAGGPGGTAGFGGMRTQTDFEVPRMPITNTAIIGDPRNDENLIVVQFHQTMLRFHNKVVELLLAASFPGDIFVKAQQLVRQHYQFAVVNDFLKRICGQTVVDAALASINPPINSPFRMPVEFSVAAYRFGHSMIRGQYWLNFNFISASLEDVFKFNRNPELPVKSDRVVDFNAFFDTGIAVPVHNKARRIDTVLTPPLGNLPGFTGLMAVLAKRNLRRGLALGLPSGQGMAQSFGVPALTTAQLTQGLPADEVAVLQSSGGVLLQKTPLWYYVLREASVLGNGNQLGPVGARIVAETFVRMLRRDAGSYLRVPGGFTVELPSATPNDFTFTDLVIFAGVTQP